MTASGNPPKVFSNFSNDLPLSIGDMCEHLSVLTGGFPIVVADQLCYREGDELRPLKSNSALVAWIDGHACVRWHRGGLTKEELFAGLIQQAPQYSWASLYPHFPAIPGVYYFSEPPAAASTGKLDALIDFYNPATAKDRTLLKAAAMTPYWGGPPGTRPAITFSATEDDPEQGRGAGKTTAAELLAAPVGGCIPIGQRTSEDRIISTLLSPTAQARRVALIDNLKTYRFSNELFERLITCKEIGGHQLYHGFASRLNLLTWFITANGASYSKDMAQRTIMIVLKRPEQHTSDWLTTVSAFIDNNRDEIAADVRYHLEQSTHEINLGRWSLWARQVLSPLGDHHDVVIQVNADRVEIDDDDADRDNTMEYVRACVAAEIQDFDPVKDVVKIPGLLLLDWMKRLKPELTTRQIAQYLKQLHSRQLSAKRTKHERFYVWTGEEAANNEDRPMRFLPYTPPHKRH